MSVEGDDVTHPRRIELLLRDVTEVFEKLLPKFTEEPRFVPTAPMEVCDKPRGREGSNFVVPMALDLFEIKNFPVPPHDIAEVAQKLDDLLKRRISLAAQRKG